MSLRYFFRDAGLSLNSAFCSSVSIGRGGQQWLANLSGNREVVIHLKFFPSGVSSSENPELIQVGPRI